MKVEKYATVYWLIVCTNNRTHIHVQPTNVRSPRAIELFLFFCWLGWVWIEIRSNSSSLVWQQQQQQINMHDSCTPIFLTRNTIHTEWFYLWARRRNIVGILSNVVSSLNSIGIELWFDLNWIRREKQSFRIFARILFIYYVHCKYNTNQKFRRLCLRKSKRRKRDKERIHCMEWNKIIIKNTTFSYEIVQNFLFFFVFGWSNK